MNFSSAEAHAFCLGGAGRGRGAALLRIGKDFLKRLDLERQLGLARTRGTRADLGGVARGLEFREQVVALLGDFGQLQLVGCRLHGLVGEAVPLLAQRGDAGLQMGEIPAGFFKHLLELRALVGLPRELALKIGGKAVGLLEIVLQSRVVRQQAGGGLRVHHARRRGLGAGRLVGWSGRFGHHGSRVAEISEVRATRRAVLILSRYCAVATLRRSAAAISASAGTRRAASRKWVCASAVRPAVCRARARW